MSSADLQLNRACVHQYHQELKIRQKLNFHLNFTILSKIQLDVLFTNSHKMVVTSGTIEINHL